LSKRLAFGLLKERLLDLIRKQVSKTPESTQKYFKQLLSVDLDPSTLLLDIQPLPTSTLLLLSKQLSASTFLTLLQVPHHRALTKGLSFQVYQVGDARIQEAGFQQEEQVILNLKDKGISILELAEFRKAMTTLSDAREFLSKDGVTFNFTNFLNAKVQENNF